MAESTRSTRPLFLEAAQDLAREFGTSVEAVLTEYRQSVRRSVYPGPNCLEPHEIEQFIDSGTLPPERQSHAENCPSCAAVLEAARPTPELWERVAEEIRPAITRETERPRRAGSDRGLPREVRGPVEPVDFFDKSLSFGQLWGEAWGSFSENNIVGGSKGIWRSAKENPVPAVVTGLGIAWLIGSFVRKGSWNSLSHLSEESREASERPARRARGSFRQLLEERPLSVGAASLGFGVLLGLFISSRDELGKKDLSANPALGRGRLAEKSAADTLGRQQEEETWASNSAGRVQIDPKEVAKGAEREIGGQIASPRSSPGGLSNEVLKSEETSEGRPHADEREPEYAR